MTWKDIKLAAMQKMFAAEGNNIPTDDSSQDYIAGMPYTANECLQMICTSKKFIIHSVDLDDTMGDIIGSYRRYDMKKVVNDFFEFYGEVYFTSNKTSSHERTTQYVTEAKDVFMVPKNADGIWTVYYKAYPETITSTTEDDHELDIPADVQVILPLYMASQLYKEDDNGIATSLRNEFEVAFERLSQDNPLVLLEEESESGW